MKALFSKILVPIDGSDYSFKAAEYAIDIQEDINLKLL